MDASQGRQVLPKTVKPVHYDLTLEPDLANFTYRGSVHIDLDVLADSSSVSLNTVDLDIQSTRIAVDGAEVESTVHLSYDEDSQTTTFGLGHALQAGQRATLSLEFTGTLNDVMAGFYRSSYKDADGSEHFLATTQMEPTDARRAFPCFDEPALKATFTVTLIADHDMTTLSNMNIAREVDVESQMVGRKRKRVTFDKTPVMSTYLLAFVVGKLKYCETNGFRVPVRVYCTPDEDEKHGMYSAELAARTLAFYEKEFGIDYPLPKMDMIGIPDYAAGAMENWGLVTYKTTMLLMDDETTSAEDKREVAETVTHELAHQWFGNLVTMDFWEGLWLKEGFATWMSIYACDAFYPEWKIWDGHVTETLREALSLDSLRSSHPIEVPVRRADEVNQIFDEISYQKGSCVIRMVSKALGEAVFMDGIRRYLSRHAYGNTVTNDLWAALSEASGKDVAKIAAIWTRDVGYPVVTVAENKEDSTIDLKQNRFLRTGDVKPEEDQIVYPIFLALKTKDGVDNELSLASRQATFKLPSLDFFKLNSEHSGIYRTLYSRERLQKLGQAARSGLLSVSDRAGLIADANALAQAGYQKTSDLLAFLRAFDLEPEFQVWREMCGCISALKKTWMFEEEQTQDALKAFQRDIVTKRAHEIGWVCGAQDGHIQQQFKALMFAAACQADDKEAHAAARDMFARFMGGSREALHSNLRRTVFSAVLRTGGQAEYDAIVREYETASVGTDRVAALSSLGSSRDPKLIQRTLDYTLSKNVRSQDIHQSVSGLISHPAGLMALWSWFQKNWEVLQAKMPPSLGQLGRLVQMATAGFSEEHQRKEVEEFFKNKKTQGMDMELAQSLDIIRSREGWLARDKADVAGYLAQSGYL